VQQHAKLSRGVAVFFTFGAGQNLVLKKKLSFQLFFFNREQLLIFCPFQFKFNQNLKMAVKTTHFSADKQMSFCAVFDRNKNENYPFAYGLTPAFKSVEVQLIIPNKALVIVQSGHCTIAFVVANAKKRK
jgi:hypothetical protein